MGEASAAVLRKRIQRLETQAVESASVLFADPRAIFDEDEDFVIVFRGKRIAWNAANRAAFEKAGIKLALPLPPDTSDVSRLKISFLPCAPNEVEPTETGNLQVINKPRKVKVHDRRSFEIAYVFSLPQNANYLNENAGT